MKNPNYFGNRKRLSKQNLAAGIRRQTSQILHQIRLLTPAVTKVAKYSG